jgi:hypothetical protein
MIFYKFRRKVRKYFGDTFNFYTTLIICFFIKPKEKRIFFDVSQVEKNRYLYNLVKFFKLNGYTVYLPKNKELICRLCIKGGEYKYSSFILNGDVKIGKPGDGKQTIILAIDNLSNDYFSKRVSENSYYVPMSQYPLFYNDVHITTDVLKTRKMSVFMSGNFNSEFYYKIATDGVFDVLSRRDIFNFLVQQPYFYQITTYEELLNFLESSIDFKTILIDASNSFRIKLLELKYILQKFNFFMALPGIDIPQSHNLIEAMEVGCIPIIQKTYSDLLYPPLVHNVNALIYETKDELDLFIKEILKQNEEVILFLRKNVLDYYDKYLTPKAVVDAIVNNNYDKIYIQGEHISLKLLMKNK